MAERQPSGRGGAGRSIGCSERASYFAEERILQPGAGRHFCIGRRRNDRCLRIPGGDQVIGWRISGSFFLGVICWAAQQEPSQPAMLSRDTVLERSLSGNEEHTYRLSLSAGQNALLTVEQKGI